MSIIEQAKRELKAINFGDDDSAVMIDLLERFFDQWDSGGAVWAVAPVLMKLIAGKPLGPLTGADDEWFIYGQPGRGYAQNLRCGIMRASGVGTAADPRCPAPLVGADRARLI